MDFVISSLNQPIFDQFMNKSKLKPTKSLINSITNVAIELIRLIND